MKYGIEMAIENGEMASISSAKWRRNAIMAAKVMAATWRNRMK
jgi:hypothetical protein